MPRSLITFSRRLSKVARAFSTVGAVLAAIIFVGMALLVVTEVVLRNTVGRSTLIVTEYSGYALAAMTYLSLAFTFREGAHIRITFLHDRLPRVLRRPFEVLLVALASYVTWVAIRAVWVMVQTSFERGTIAYTVARTPLYLPQALILVGLGLLLLQLVAYGISVAVTGDLLETISEQEEVERLAREAGGPSMQAEASASPPTDGSGE